MRLRFFVIILFIFLLTVTLLGIAQSFISRQERLRLIDQRLEEMASAIYSSEISTGRMEDIREASDIIADVLGDERMNAVVAIYNRQGKVLFRDSNATLIDPTFASVSSRSLIERHGHVVRMLTVPLEDRDLVLQVGLILDTTLVRWRLLSLRMGLFAGLTLLLVVAMSYFLSYQLLKPIEKIAQYLFHRVSHFEESASDKTPPLSQLFRFQRYWNEDEVWRLVSAVQALLAKAQEAERVTRSRAAQLAHELKTPLTIARNQLEQSRAHFVVDSLPAHELDQALGEIEHLRRIVDTFTQWSLFDSAPGEPAPLHAIKLQGLATELAGKLDRLHPGRLRVTVDGNATVFANADHLEQALSNLLVNALKYSPEGSFVDFHLEGAKVTVRDYGPGIEPDVLHRLGTPFNLGSSSNTKQGTGLGLAWVHAIARRYRWRLLLQNVERGTEAILVMEEGPLAS